MKGCEGKHAWVLGGGSGIGAAAALALARAGARVTISGRREDQLGKVCAQAQPGGSIIGLPLDITDPSAVEAAQRGLEDVSILVYSAGTNIARRHLKDLSGSDWRNVMDVNLQGAYLAVQSVLSGMRRRRDGLIILVSSWAGWRADSDVIRPGIPT